MSTHRASWRQAYDMQMAQSRWQRSEDGLGVLNIKLQHECEGLRPETRELLYSLYSSEDAKLLGADPIFVSREMCEVVAAASDPDQERPFQAEPLYVTDLPTAIGFMVYERPFDILDRFDRPVEIAACAWQPMFTLGDDETPTGLDAEALMRDWNDASAERGFEPGQSRAAGITLSLYETLGADAVEACRERGITPPPLDLVHLTPWWFGMAFEGNEVDENDVPTGAGWWWRIVQTTLRLMQQRVAVQHHERPERHQRREAKRYHFPERDVLVIRLRREATEGNEPSGEPGNWTHRWLVGGHWRNQFYPASDTHRQIWISPYVKGPEDLPLVVKPRRAMVWDR